VLPGGSVDMEVQIDPRRIPGFKSRKTLTIFSNDPQNPALMIGVSASVDPEFAVEPETIEFGVVKKGEKLPEINVRVRQLLDEPLELTNLTSFGAGGSTAVSPDLDLSLAKLPEEEWAAPGMAEYEITATINENAALGGIDEFVQVETNVPRLPRIRIPVSATIESFYYTNPSYPAPLLLKPPSADEAPIDEATVVGSDAPVEVTNVQAPAPLNIVVEQGGHPNEKDLVVTIAPEQAETGPLDEVVTFDVTSADGKVAKERLNVRGYVRQNLAS